MRLWRENGVDTVLAILAVDGDRAYNFATVNTTLAAGARPANRVRVCQGSFAAKESSAGYAPDLGGQPMPHGKVMYGMARQYMRDEARDIDNRATNPESPAKNFQIGFRFFSN